MGDRSNQQFGPRWKEDSFFDLRVEVLREADRNVMRIKPNAKLAEGENRVYPCIHWICGRLREGVWVIVRILYAITVSLVHVGIFPVSCPRKADTDIWNGVLIEWATALNHVHDEIGDLSKYRKVTEWNLIV